MEQGINKGNYRLQITVVLLHHSQSVLTVQSGSDGLSHLKVDTGEPSVPAREFNLIACRKLNRHAGSSGRRTHALPNYPARLLCTAALRALAQWATETGKLVPCFVKNFPSYISKHWRLCNNNNNISEIGRRASLSTADPLETTFLYQRISTAIQHFNAVYLSNTFTISEFPL